MKNTNILFRDDDVNVYTCPMAFKKLHEEFKKREKVHTVAVIMRDLWENHALFYYLATEPFLEIGLHGLTHKDYSLFDYETCLSDLQYSLQYWEENSKRMLGAKECKKIDTFFAPWNHSGIGIKEACKKIGLKFCDVKKGEWDGKYINSFHHWYFEMYPKDIKKLFKI